MAKAKESWKTVLITIILMGLGLSSDIAKDLSKSVLCKIQKSECILEVSNASTNE